jgi:hypothetical protein
MQITIGSSDCKVTETTDEFEVSTPFISQTTSSKNETNNEQNENISIKYFWKKNLGEHIAVTLIYFFQFDVGMNYLAYLNVSLRSPPCSRMHVIVNQHIHEQTYRKNYQIKTNEETYCLSPYFSLIWKKKFMGEHIAVTLIFFQLLWG